MRACLKIGAYQRAVIRPGKLLGGFYSVGSVESGEGQNDQIRRTAVLPFV